MHAFLTRLNRVCSFKEVRYAGERNSSVEIAVLTSFPSAEIYTLTTQNTLLRGGIAINLALEGYIVEVKTNNSKIGVVSSFNSDDVAYNLIARDYQILVANAQVEELSALSKPKQTVCFLQNPNFVNAEVNGNLEYLI